MDVNEPSREHREPVADQRACLGIAVLSSALKLLHLNRRAADLFDHINRAERGVPGERFRLTEREQAVVEHLIKGWTNKEIAANIGVAEQTVKEHIKHIMGKTGSTTRTALLVKILQPWMPLGQD